MAIKTQGTNLFCMDPDTGEVIDVGCVTQISGIDETLDQIETTCLGDRTRTYEAGLATPGTANFTVQFDPQNSVHIQMYNYKKIGKVLDWAVGFRDEEAEAGGFDPRVPTSTTDSDGNHIFDLPTERAFIVFEGYMNSYPFEFAGNTVVTSNVGVQVSGEIDIVPAVAST